MKFPNPSNVRTVLAVVVGVLVGFLAIVAIELLTSRLYPPPPGVDPMDPANAAAFAAHVATLPALAFLLLLFGHGLGSLLGGGVATLVAGGRSLRPALVLGCLLLAAGIANLRTIPHPAWVAVIDVLLYVPFAWVGGRTVLARRGPAVT